MMHSRAHPAIASQHYQSLELKSRVESAGPHALVGLLYEELLRSIDLVTARCRQGHDVQASPAYSKAQSIFIALENSLDFDQGGDLAVNLARIYRAGRNSLTEAAKANDQAKLREIRDAVSHIAYAWQALAN
jgi:flagellar secretion chaperone FliS